MEYNNRGIILHSSPYGENGLIVYMFTQSRGRMSYFLRTAKNGKLTIGSNRVVLQPFSSLDFIESVSSDQSQIRIKEAHRSIINSSTIFDIRKSTISLFLAEFIYRVVKEESPNEQLFEFIYNSIAILDTMDEGVSNFHLFFLAKMTQHIGFFPQTNWQEGSYFDIALGRFTLTRPLNHSHVEPDLAAILYNILTISISDLKNIKIVRSQRVEIIRALIAYYEHHNGTRYKIASLEMMGELF